MTAAQLFERANQASADAMRYSRQPHGERMAKMRQSDALKLRQMARDLLRFVS